MGTYYADLNPVIESKQQVGDSWRKNAWRSPDLENTASTRIQELESKVEQQKVSCFSKDDLQACGYILAAEQTEKRIGPLSFFQSRVPAENASFVDSPTHYIIIKSNSSEQEVIVDTGCSHTGFSSSFIEENPTHFEKVTDAKNYDIGLYRASGVNLYLGKTKKFSPLAIFEAPVLDLLEGTEIGRRFISIIGQDFLSSRPYEINYDNNVMIIDQDVKKRVGEGEWKTVPFRAKPSPYFLVSLDIYVNGTKLPFILDTGASSSDIVPVCADHLALETVEGNSIQQGVSHNYESESSKPLSVIVAGHTLDDMVMSISTEDDPTTKAIQMVGACGILGLDVLHQFNLIYDPYTFNLYFQKRENVSSVRVPSLGILPNRDKDDGKLVVKGVATKSPANKAGLQIDDKIISVNGIPSEKMTIYGFREYTIKNAPPFVFVVSRGGKEKAITVQKTSLTAMLQEDKR